MSDFVWGTVTAVSPFRVRLDGDTAELPFSSDSLVTAQSLVIADRVRVELSGTRVIVHGRNGGDGDLLTGISGDITSLDSRVGDVEAAVTLLETRPQGVIPSSVVVGSGSASVAADGTVTFAGCSSVSLNGVFDGTGMDCYDLLLEYTTGTTSGAMIRFRKSGTDDTASVYDIARFLSPTSGSAYPATSLAQNSGFLVMSSLPAGTSYSSVRAEIFKPGEAVGTLVTARGLTTLNPMTASTYIGQWMNGILHRPAVAQDGMTIYSSSGTLSGTMKVVKIG